MSVLRGRLLYLCAGMLLLGIAAAAAAFNWGRGVGRASPVAAAPAPAIQATFFPAAVAEATRDPFQATVAVATFAPPKPWDGKERLNILVMGIDQRVGEQELGYRTDTMLVLTLDPVNRQAGVLSIPRDLWVNIPGYGYAKVNTANDKGDRVGYPGGGAALAKKTVENFLGIKIHHYVRMNFTAFEDMIDRLGGVSIDVAADINDPYYPTSNYGTEVFKISKGRQVLDGSTALKYARTRHNSTDFERSKRQQQVIIAVQERLKDPKVAVSLIANAPELMQNLSSSLTTDLTLDQIQRLAALVVQIDRANIRSAVIDENYTEYRDTADGLNVVVANRSAIAKLRASFFSAQ